MIHYLTPYSIHNNIGQAYNQACSLVPNDDDWIVIRDGDTMFLTPDWGRLIHDVLSVTDYALLGAKTNRVNDSHQKEKGMFSEMDMKEHYKKAKQIQDMHYDTVTHTRFDIAGFLMAFQKKTWKEVGGFDEKTPLFDRMFTRKVLAKGGKVGVMQGLYVLHAYRLWADEPTQDVSHLGV